MKATFVTLTIKVEFRPWTKKLFHWLGFFCLLSAGLGLLIWDWLGREVDDSKHDWWINQW
jgi:hypothetical protein